MEKAKQFFSQYINTNDFKWMELPQSGSSRKNFIAKTPKNTFVVTENHHLLENESFFYFSEIFSNLKLNTPQIFKISEDRTIYIQEFLGENTLFQIIENEGLNKRVKTLVEKTLLQLFNLQNATKSCIDYSKTFEYETYDEFPILNDLNYFKFLFVDILELTYHKTSLLKEFKRLTSLIEKLEPRGLMIRDFQARNIMVNHEDDVFFIDYQSTMKGPAMYDVVSFLYQAKANFPEDFRRKILNFYINLFENKSDKLSLEQSVMPIRLIRNLQVLGAYGLRGLVQKKIHFKNSIFSGIDNLSETAKHWSEMENFPELNHLIKQLKHTAVLDKIKAIM